MNDLLRDLIKVGDVAAFMVETEIEEAHDDIVEEVLRRMAENDLLVKPEKYVWNIREIGFLEVVIGPDEVKKWRWRRRKYKKW